MAVNVADEFYQDICFMIGHLVICMNESGLDIGRKEIIYQLEYKLLERDTLPDDIADVIMAAINSLQIKNEQ